jgi:hypothetical protein
MANGMTQENRRALIDALLDLATEIEKSPPLIIGSDIFVQASHNSRVVGSSISVDAGSEGGSGVGQRVSVVAQPGQSVIGQRITVVARAGASQAPPSGALSEGEIIDAVAQLKEAASALVSSPASEGWIGGMLKKVASWGSAALSGAISGATNAATRFYLTGS